MLQWVLDLNFSFLGVGVSFALIFFLFRRLTATVLLLKKQLVQVQNEVRALNSGTLGMGRKINQMADLIANNEIEKVNQAATGEQSTISEKIYQQAGILLSRGASIEEVVDSCDIAPAEAELLAIMNQSALLKASA